MAVEQLVAAAVGPSDELSPFDARLLNEIQRDFPLEPAPYAVLGQRLGVGQATVIDRITALRAANIIRQISAIFDTARLGYQSSLVAARYEPDQLDGAAAIISGHPGVSHNYERDHTFNLWYTLATPPSGDLPGTVARLHELSGALASRRLPSLRLFKIAVQLDMTGADDAAAVTTSSDHAVATAPARQLAAIEIAAVRALQRDLAATPRPFAAAAAAVNLAEADLIDLGRGFLAAGVMRRFAAVLRHRRAGFRANAMTVWPVPAAQIEAVGQQIAAFKAVSHCYQRPTYPDWPYSVFAMLHGRTETDCQQTIDAIAAATGISDYAVLYSRREFKKTRLTYFDPAHDEWTARFGVSAETANPAAGG